MNILKSLGAPFWFNALKTLIGLRPAQAKKEDEKQKEKEKSQGSKENEKQKDKANKS